MQKGLAPILIVLVVALLGIAGFWIFLRIFAKADNLPLPLNRINQTNATAQPSSSTTESTDSADASNWKTYTSTELGFSINYPNSWTIYDNSTPPCKGNIPGYVFINKTPLKDCYFADVLPADFYISVGDKWNPLPELLPKESNSPYTLSGETGILNFSTKTSEGPRRIDTRIFVNHNNQGWEVSYPNTDYKGSHDKIYDQILSTFKFTQ